MIESIVVKNNPVTLWESFHCELERPQFSISQMSLRDIGWYYEARFKLINPTKLDALMWLNNGPGRDISFYNDKANMDWEGFINAVTLSKGDADAKNSLTNLSNEVWVRYSDLTTGLVSRSNVASHVASQARYGQKDWVLNGGELEADEADQLAQIWLDRNFWATPQLQRINIGESARKKELELEFYCLGYWHTLNWKVYNQTAVTGTTAASTIVAAIITEVGDYIASTSIDTNDLLHTREYDADRRGGDIVEAITRVGFANNQPGVCGVRDGREFFFEPAVPSGLVSD